MPQTSSRWTRIRAWGIPLGALVAGGALGAGAMSLWGSSAAAAPAAFSAGDAASAQQTVTVALQTLEQTVSTSGTLAAVSSDSLAFDASGAVTTVYVEAGDTVEAGDVIAEIDTLQLTASLREAEAQLAQGEAQLANLEDAADGSDSSDAQIAAAEAQVAVLAQSVDDAEEAMAGYQLVADISGLVTAQPYAVGDVVSGGSSGSSGGTTPTSTGSTTTTASSGVTIVGQDEWTVSVSLAEADVSLISEGDQVTFAADDVDGEFYGIVTDIANLPTTTGGSATYAVELQVTGAVEGVYEGTSVTAEIVYLRQVDVLAVPTNAISTTDGVSTVTVVDDAGAETVTEVTVGETIGTYTEILDGLAEGDELLVTTVTAASGSSDGQEVEGFGEMPGGGEIPGGGEMPTGDLPGGMGTAPQG